MVAIRTTVGNRFDYEAYCAVRDLHYTKDSWTVDKIQLCFRQKPIVFREIPPAVTVDEVCHVPEEEDIELLDVEWING